MLYRIGRENAVAQETGVLCAERNLSSLQRQPTMPQSQAKSVTSCLKARKAKVRSSVSEGQNRFVREPHPVVEFTTAG